MSFTVATDVGGTCTDTVVVGADGLVHIGKALSTPPNFADGVVNSISNAAESMGRDMASLLRETRLFMHGSTVVDNALFERTGAITALLTTAGFEDTLLATRGAYGRWSGLNEEGLKHPVATDRPAALVPAKRTAGIRERVDYKGAVIQELDEQAARRTITELVEQHGASAIAVALLWSFKNPAHEQRLGELIKEIAPDSYVSLSSEIAPVPGEYERTSTAVINAYTGQVVHDYITSLGELLLRHGYSGTLLVMQGYGGLLPAEQAASRAVGMLECGPAAGVIGSRFLGGIMGDKDVIAADMGGTTFKVGIIQDGEIEYAKEPLVDRYHYAVPKMEVVSIGAGGGSIVTLEPDTKAPIVGPRSAGASPGPICYGLGGREPTLTDMFLIAGYIDPNRFLGGSMTLDTDAVGRIVREKIADPMGKSVEDAAAGVIRVGVAQLTDLIHKITVEQGLDPRDFVMHAFGGSCPMVAGLIGRELGVKRILVPYAASVNCAFGLASANVAHEYAETETHVLPMPLADFNAMFEPMLARAKADLEAEGFAADKMQFNCSVGMRYALQVHEIVTPVPGPLPCDEAGMERLVEDFEKLYETKYGKGSAYRDAGIEISQFRVSAQGIIDPPSLAPGGLGDANASHAQTGTRAIFVDGADGFADAAVYDFSKLTPGNCIAGPAVIHTPITTVIVQPGQIGSMDAYKNIVLEES